MVPGLMHLARAHHHILYIRLVSLQCHSTPSCKVKYLLTDGVTKTVVGDFKRDASGFLGLAEMLENSVGVIPLHCALKQDNRFIAIKLLAGVSILHNQFINQALISLLLLTPHEAMCGLRES